MRVKSIEIWRLLFSISIVLCHAELLPWNVGADGIRHINASTQGVEFFFLLSGFLMAQSVYREKQISPSLENLGGDTISFLMRKMKPIFPAYLFASAFELAIHYFLRFKKPSGVIFRIWDILFLRATGLGYGRPMAVGGSWYLSAMFIAMWILYPLLKRYTNVFTHVIAPLSALFIFGWFEWKHGHINFALSIQNGICLGLLRAISVMCLGMFCYELCEKLKHNFTDNKPSVFITASELLSLGGILYITTQVRRTKADFLCIILIGIGIIAAFSGKSYTNVWLKNVNNNIISWMSSYSLALYLNHYVWLNTFADWKPAIPYWTEFSIYISLSLLTALVCLMTVQGFQKIIKNINSNRTRII